MELVGDVAGERRERVLCVELDDNASAVGHRERHAAVVLGERVGVEVGVDLLRDRDAGVAEDLGELEDVAAGGEEEAGEGVAEVVDAELLVDAGADDGGLEGAEDARLVAGQLLVEGVALRTGPEEGVLALRELHLAEDGQYRVEDRDVTQAARLGGAAPAAVHVDHAVL